jgi:hypothetical protein
MLMNASRPDGGQVAGDMKVTRRDDAVITARNTEHSASQC